MQVSVTKEKTYIIRALLRMWEVKKMGKNSLTTLHIYYILVTFSLTSVCVLGGFVLEGLEQFRKQNGFDHVWIEKGDTGKNVVKENILAWSGLLLLMLKNCMKILTDLWQNTKYIYDKLWGQWTNFLSEELGHKTTGIC